MLRVVASCAAQEVTAKEREGWWAALMLRPGATLVVWRVGVLDSALLAAERKDLATVQSDSEAPGSRLRVSQRLLSARPQAFLTRAAPSPQQHWCTCMRHCNTCSSSRRGRTCCVGVQEALWCNAFVRCRTLTAKPLASRFSMI